MDDATALGLDGGGRRRARGGPRSDRGDGLPGLVPPVPGGLHRSDRGRHRVHGHADAHRHRGGLPRVQLLGADLYPVPVHPAGTVHGLRDDRLDAPGGEPVLVARLLLRTRHRAGGILSFWTFNTTLTVSGLVLTTLSSFITQDLFTWARARARLASARRGSACCAGPCSSSGCA
ncbi:hypothetical protein ACFFX0_33005 [Citricoccus parietis]|uniref:Uncharacterized protein n=1 Tax=Citricoccus parietis TaxID=592307 RepID=A0ABV5G9V3_9MICC